MSTPRPEAQPASIALVVGITIDSARVDRVDGLLADLCALSADPECAGLDVVLLPNGLCPGLQEVVERHRRLGLRCHPIAPHGEGRAPIGRNRTVLQAHVYALAKERPGSVGWIIDDDMRLDALVTRGGVPHRERALRLGDLINYRKQGIAVVLGPETDAPPVPAAGMVRVQLVDLHHNLRWLAGLAPDLPLPDRFLENLAFMRRCKDFHYDLARRNTDQLEAPFWLTPACPGETVREAFDRLADRLPRILAGEQIFRPIALDLARPPKPEGAVNRGGNTFVLDIEALRDFPNSVPEIGGREVRRSDMIWSLLNKHYGKRRIVRAPLALRHDRSGQPAQGLDLDHAASDFRGYALYSALLDHFEGPGDFDFALHRFKKYLRERLASFDMSFHRVRGLVKSIRLSLADGRAWWRGQPAAEAIRRFVDSLEAEYRPERLQEFHDLVFFREEEALRAYLDGLKTTLEFHRNSPEPISFEGDPRAENAKAQVERLCGPGSFRELGRGAEGVVLTDDRLVYKVIDYWKPRDPAEQRAFLRGLVGRWPDAASLYPILDVKEDGVHAVIVYPYEPARPYEGGHGPGLVRLLRECRRYGIACTNIHPQNLRVADTGLRFVDYGADIRPLDPEGWLHMCRRAWLTWRWHHRPDLKDLMRRALQDFDLPELDGFDRFLSAVSDTTAQEDLDDLIEEEVRA